MTRDELDMLREGWDFEGKLAAGPDGRGVVPDSFWETYSAMANGQGGRIVLGLREQKDGTFDVRGIPDVERVERDLWNMLQNRNKISANLLTSSDVERQAIDGSAILVVSVPRARRQDRPVFVNDDLWGGTFLRVHEGDRRADRDRIRRMVAEAEFDSRDERVLVGFDLADLSADTLRSYRDAFRATHADHPWAQGPDRDFLTRLNVWSTDRETGREGLTVGGLLMFGRHETIIHALPNFFLDYQERYEDTGAIEWTDRLFPDGTWSGNLYDFFRRVVLKLKADLKVPFQLGPDMIRRDETHVHEAVREALVNTLIHADYEGRISVLVVKRRDSFEFRNPGMPRLPIEEIRQGGHSDCRNRTVQQLFLRLGIGEQAGSGFSRILRAWGEQHWQVPILDEDVVLDTTTLRLTMSSLLPPTVVEALDERFGSEFRHLPADARMALALAYQNGEVSHARLTSVSGTHPRDLTLTLQSLVRKCMLERDRPGRGWKYRLPSPERSIERTAVESQHTRFESEQIGESSPQTSPQSAPDSPQSATDSPQSGLDASPSQPASSLPTDVVARVPTTRWARGNDIRSALVAACHDRFVTLHELGSLLNRSPRTLQQHYVRLLVAQGRLVLRHPEQPNHPEQAYRAADLTGIERPE